MNFYAYLCSGRLRQRSIILIFCLLCVLFNINFVKADCSICPNSAVRVFWDGKFINIANSNTTQAYKVNYSCGYGCNYLYVNAGSTCSLQDTLCTMSGICLSIFPTTIKYFCGSVSKCI